MEVKQVKLEEKIVKIKDGKYQIESLSIVELDSQALLATADRAKKEIDDAKQDKLLADKAMKTRRKYLKDNGDIFKEATETEKTRDCRSCGMDLIENSKKRFEDEDICNTCQKVNGVA